MPSTLARLAPLTGVLAVVIGVIAAIIAGESPAADDSTEEVITFWTENDSANQWSAALFALAAALIVWFGGTLRAALRRHGGDDAGRLAAIAFGGFVIVAIGMTSFSGFAFAAADTVGDVPPEVTQTLSVLNSDFFFIIAMGNLVAFGASGIAILRHGALASWLGWVAVVIAVAAITPIGFFLFLAGLVWIVVAAVMLYQQGTPAGSATAPSP
jgi:hypothetical protein